MDKAEFVKNILALQKQRKIEKEREINNYIGGAVYRRKITLPYYKSH